MKRLVSFLLTLAVFFTVPLLVSAEGEEENQDRLGINAVSCVLMEAETGKILYAKNEGEALPPASVTKIMTLLLVMEAVDSGKIALGDMVQISQYASSMGGSQVFLEEGESFSVEELIKCTVIASANDAAVALAEHVCGSEASFVEAMNQRAKELGLVSTHFENVTGLDDTTVQHETSALDIAIMSRMLISHPLILQYSSIWMDSIRDGAFTLTNTNRLVRFYNGATGLKTGSTAKAKFCLSATATRDGMTLICVIMASPTRDDRNSEAMRLLDWGFANYTLFRDQQGEVCRMPVTHGTADSVPLWKGEFCAVIPKDKRGEVQSQTNVPDTLAAPLSYGAEVGSVTYSLDGQVIGVCPVWVQEEVPSISFVGLFVRILKTFLHPC